MHWFDFVVYLLNASKSNGKHGTQFRSHIDIEMKEVNFEDTMNAVLVAQRKEGFNPVKVISKRNIETL